MNARDIPSAITDAIGPILRVSVVPQGKTSEVAIAETANGRFAIKRAEGTLYGSWLSNEYSVLSSLATIYSNVPYLAPLPRAFFRDTSGIVTECWMATDYLPGVTLEAALRETSSISRRATWLRSFGQTLARIHTTLPPPVLIKASPTWLDAMLEEASENLEHFIVDGTPELLERLRSRQPASITTVLIHGDYSVDNVIVDEDKVTGIIDWSAGAVGDPRYDLALGTRPQHVAFEENRTRDLESFYEGYGSAPLNKSEYDYFIGLYEFF